MSIAYVLLNLWYFLNSSEWTMTAEGREHTLHIGRKREPTNWLPDFGRHYRYSPTFLFFFPSGNTRGLCLLVSLG